ncbi:MAG: hypothetical protein QM724_13355 [Flavobacteriales bacterium]
MKNIYFLFLPFLLLCQCVTAQTFSSEERRKEAEDILNTAINNVVFDSVYTQKTVYFLANELLTKNSPLILKKNKCRVIILNEDEIKKVKQYVVLGDFTLDWNNPVAVRVQLSVSPNKTLDFGLVKESGKWIIKNHIIFED